MSLRTVYECNEHCKNHKNVDNTHYKLIPAAHRTYDDGSISHVTGIVNISAEDHEAMPPRFDGEWLRSNFPGWPSRPTASSTRSSWRRTANCSATSRSSDTLNLYRARNRDQPGMADVRPRRPPFASSPAFLLGDSAIGSPNFQSISLGLECAMFLAGLIAQRDLTLRDMFDRYELHMYKQWSACTWAAR